MHWNTVAVEKRSLGSSWRATGIVSGQVSGKDIKYDAADMGPI